MSAYGLQEADLSDSQNVLHSRGLEKFAIRAGLYNPAHGRPFSFFEAFMDHGAAQATYSHPRVRTLQRLLGGKGGAEGQVGYWVGSPGGLVPT